VSNATGTESSPPEGGAAGSADAEATDPAQVVGSASLALDLAGIGLWRQDLRSDAVHYSPQSWRLLGMAPRDEPLTLAQVRERIHPDDLPVVQAAAARALTSDVPTDMEARYRHADGSWRFMMTRRVLQRDAQGQPLAYFGVGMDVTEMRRAEHELRAARERAALAANAVGLGTWEIDVLSGQTYWDEGMWTLRGLQPGPTPPDHAQRLARVHPDDRAAVAEANERSLERHTPLELEFRIVRPDGQVRWLASRAVSLFDAEGRPLRRIGVNWDITDSRQAAAARQDIELARRESQAKSRFLSRMSHELRTPLNAVLGFSQLLLATERGDDAATAQRRAQLAHIERAGQHLLSLISDVLDLSSLEGGEVRIRLQPVDLAALVLQTLPMVQRASDQRGIVLHSDVPPLTVLADPVRLRQALLNVLSNAVKYNRPGGAVQVQAQREGATVALQVADTGPGLTDQQQRQLFEPFNRLGAEHQGIEGTGIGLAIVKTLMERMQGGVQVHSTPGQGSVFTLRLQVAPAAGAGED
jgi:PAS domain S-box-containing protein